MSGDFSQAGNAGYVPPKPTDLETLKNLDQEDESLRRWKESLIGNAPAPVASGGDTRNVVVEKLSLVVDGRPNVDLDLTGDLAKLKERPFGIKEGCDYRLGVTFRVQSTIVAGLKYLHIVYRKGVKVDKTQVMVGSYGPNPQPYFFKSAPETAPGGMVARGHYDVKSRFMDDDNHIHLQWEWSFDIGKDWAPSAGGGAPPQRGPPPLANRPAAPGGPRPQMIPGKLPPGVRPVTGPLPPGVRPILVQGPPAAVVAPAAATTATPAPAPAPSRPPPPAAEAPAPARPPPVRPSKPKPAAPPARPTPPAVAPGRPRPPAGRSQPRPEEPAAPQLPPFPCARTVCQYVPKTDDELGFDEGEIIKLRGLQSEGVYRCQRSNGEVGSVPDAFVRVLKLLPNKYPLEGPRAIGLYNFDGETEEDLYFCVNEEIQLLGRVDPAGAWLRGRVDKREGIFPAEFVKIVERLPRGASCTSGPRAVAKFDYLDGSEGDLQFEAGDIIALVEEVDSEWLKGDLEGQVGIFPKMYVEAVQKLSAWVDGPRCYALYDFTDGESPDDLIFEKGDVIRVTQHIDEEWARGTVDGRFEGLFPKMYVEMIEE